MTRTLTALALMAATSAEAGGFGPSLDGSGVVLVPAAAAVEPTPLEWLRYIRPREGRDVVVPVVGGGSVQTIEWWRPVELRVRTESGAALTERERAAIRAEAVRCRRGTPASAEERTESNGTFVIEYRCAWLQGYEDQ
jgi:hypothetical protein